MERSAPPPVRCVSYRALMSACTVVETATVSPAIDRGVKNQGGNFSGAGTCVHVARLVWEADTHALVWKADVDM